MCPTHFISHTTTMHKHIHTIQLTSLFWLLFFLLTLPFRIIFLKRNFFIRKKRYSQIARVIFIPSSSEQIFTTKRTEIKEKRPVINMQEKNHWKKICWNKENIGCQCDLFSDYYYYSCYYAMIMFLIFINNSYFSLFLLIIEFVLFLFSLIDSAMKIKE